MLTCRVTAWKAPNVGAILVPLLTVDGKKFGVDLPNIFPAWTVRLQNNHNL